MNALTDDLEILPGTVEGTLAVPPSKSHTNRALLLAALANGESIVRNPLRSDDANAMVAGLRALGVRIDDAGDRLVIHGTGRFTPPETPIFCRDSGTTIRFLTAAAATADFPITVTGSPQLCRRPMDALLDALAGLGARVTATNACPPITIQGPLHSFQASVNAARSSQYASALLMALGASGMPDAGVRVQNLVSAPYVAMTLDSMAAFGVTWREVPDQPGMYVPAAPGGYQPADYAVEFDASAAGHIWAVAALGGGSVTVRPALRATGQPDIRLLDILEDMGCEVSETRGGIRLERRGPLHAAGRVNMADWPDMVSTLAVVAAFADGVTDIVGVAHARGHETDRLTATATELSRMGVAVVEQPDGLTITGGAPHGARVHSYGDHRMAMAFAAAGAAIPGVVIHDPGCVRKTYPDFWNDLARIGVSTREAP